MRKTLLLLATQFLALVSILAQQKSSIVGTNLRLNLESGFVMDEDSPSIHNEKYGIAFMEMAGINFSSQVGDFDDIKEKYAEKGIEVEKKYRGKIGNYDALFINLNSTPSLHQIFFGNESFCALVNITGVDSTIVLNDKEIKTVLSSIEYFDSKKSALDEHANFILKDPNMDWSFETYSFNSFGFENKITQDALMIMQLPPSTLLLSTKEYLANEFIGKFKESIPDAKVVEQGNWKVNDIDGHRVILELSKNDNLELIYLFVFSSSKSAFVFQGMGKINDPETINRFEALLNNLKLK